MSFDDIIIGGGLAGLLCGIRLQKHGRSSAVISSGQNAMHFSSGTFELLSRDAEGKAVSKPLEAISALPETHPYSRIGRERIAAYAAEIVALFGEAGVRLTGSVERNSRMLSPLGIVKPAWLALEDVTLLDSRVYEAEQAFLVVNFKGYLDFNADYIAAAFRRGGKRSSVVELDIAEISRLRTNPSEMRSVNIARVMEGESALNELISGINALIEARTETPVLVLPSVFGLKSTAALERLRTGVHADLLFVGTMPPSIPGIRSQFLLKSLYEHLGGTMLPGDVAERAELMGGSVNAIRTSNFGNTALKAENYILATGSFFSRGLWSTPNAVIEPLFDLDVDSLDGREHWYDRDFFSTQNYIGFGVKTDGNFHPFRDGEVVRNLYAIGSVLGGYNPIELGCGAGVAMMTAMAVADGICGSKAEDAVCGLGEIGTEGGSKYPSVIRNQTETDEATGKQ